MSTRYPTIGRGAVATACRILEAARTNRDIDGMFVEYGLDEDVGLGGSIATKLLNLQKFTAANPYYSVKTDLGEKPIGVFVVEQAIHRIPSCSGNAELWDKLERYLNLDGYALLRDSVPGLFADGSKIVGVTVALPDFVDMPTTTSEVDVLLNRYRFDVAQRHLASAKENVAQADWEAANGQCRTFLEALTDAISDLLFPVEARPLQGGLQKRQLLAEKGFLSREKHEFGDGGGQAFLPGLAKLLHSDGAHPGISTQHDAMFRLQAVVVTARWLLKRIEQEGPWPS